MPFPLANTDTMSDRKTPPREPPSKARDFETLLGTIHLDVTDAGDGPSRPFNNARLTEAHKALLSLRDQYLHSSGQRRERPTVKNLYYHKTVVNITEMPLDGRKDPDCVVCLKFVPVQTMAAATVRVLPKIPVLKTAKDLGEMFPVPFEFYWSKKAERKLVQTGPRDDPEINYAEMERVIWQRACGPARELLGHYIKARLPKVPAVHKVFFFGPKSLCGLDGTLDARACVHYAAFHNVAWLLQDHKLKAGEAGGMDARMRRSGKPMVSTYDSLCSEQRCFQLTALDLIPYFYFSFAISLQHSFVYIFPFLVSQLALLAYHTPLILVWHWDSKEILGLGLLFGKAVVSDYWVSLFDDTPRLCVHVTRLPRILRNHTLFL